MISEDKNQDNKEIKDFVKLTYVFTFHYRKQKSMVEQTWFQRNGERNYSKNTPDGNFHK